MDWIHWTHHKDKDKDLTYNDLQVKCLTNLCSAIKSEDSEALGRGTSQIGSQFDEIQLC